MSFRIVISGFEAAGDRLDALASFDRASYLDALGGIVASQAQDRIRNTKTAPDGTPWKPNREGTSTLFRSGALDDSIHHVVSGDSVAVGSNLVYAGVHQAGATIVPREADMLAFFAGGAQRFARSVTIPARPYVGISADNAREIESFTRDFLAGALQ